MGKGRPTKSGIRQNMVDILYFMKNAYGYDLYKVYKEVFPNVTMRVIYYHLKKGVDLGEFKIHKIQKEEGDYSWGSTVEKIYYSLGPEAKPIGSFRIKESLEKLKKLGDDEDINPISIPKIPSVKNVTMLPKELFETSKETEQSKNLSSSKKGLS